jgi:hypothetical protein
MILLFQKTTNENRCISIDMLQVKEGYNFKLFANSVNQTIRQDIYGHHLLLSEPFNQPKAALLPYHHQLPSPNHHHQYSYPGPQHKPLQDRDG